MKKKIIIILSALVCIFVISFFVINHLKKFIWETVVCETDTCNSDYGQDPTVECLRDFQVKDILETKLIWDMKVNSGVYYITIYWVPEDEEMARLHGATHEEFEKAYLAGYRMEVTDRMEEVYHAEYSETGTYTIDTASWREGVYLIKTYGSADADIEFRQYYKYRHYNWMDLEAKICHLLGKDFNSDKYMPY